MNTENTREKKIEQMFAQNAELSKVFVTSDDFGFTDENKANSYATSLKNKKVVAYSRDAFFPTKNKSEILDQGVKKLTAALEEVTDIKTLQALKEEEESLGDEARKTAVKAIEERIEVLVKDIEIKE